MSRLLRVGLTMALLVTPMSFAWASANLNLSKSNINKEFPKASFVTATVTLTDPNETKTVFTTPGTGDFILTQACVSFVNGGMRIAATGLGPIADVGAPTCQVFDPGMSVPKTSDITCSTTSAASPGGDYFCTVSGMLRP